jgi:hypothetical protein
MDGDTRGTRGGTSHDLRGAVGEGSGRQKMPPVALLIAATTLFKTLLCLRLAEGSF